MILAADAALLVRLGLGVTPVCLFLLSLMYLDSYKLVRLSSILQMIGAGAIAAAVAYSINLVLFAETNIEHHLWTTFAVPLIEEVLKALPLLLLVKLKRIGFLVDAAILGFAIGTGFALVENVYYFLALPESSPALWLVRGFGTAIMHGGSTAMVGTMTKAMGERAQWSRGWFVVPGLLAAYIFHAFFNSFLVPPAVSALIVLVVFPLLLLFVFIQSERYLRSWLGSGFDLHSELLDNIKSGNFRSSPAGLYLQSLRDHLDGPVLADMLCILRIHAELSLRAKGMLMLRESGLPVKRDREINDKLEELRYLKRSIGRTGTLAIAPILSSSEQDVWQLRMLEKA